MCHVLIWEICGFSIFLAYFVVKQLQQTNSMPEQPFRLRLTYAKTEAMRYTGHLDVQRTLERMFRRAGLPLLHTQGYHPRPKMHLAAALPLGCTSEHEIAEFWLKRPMPVEEVENALRAASPPGIEVLGVEAVPPDNPPLPNLVVASEYIITFLDPMPELPQKVKSLLKAEQLPRTRRGKNYDLRPLIEALEILPPDAEGHQRVKARLSARQGATGRPDELANELGAPISTVRIHRVKQILGNG